MAARAVPIVCPIPIASAARAIHPLPADMLLENHDTQPIERNAPAKPQNTPLITNAVAQTLKGETKVILFPVDQTSEDIETIAPDGLKYVIRAREVDLENTDALRLMPGVIIVNESDVSLLINDMHKNEKQRVIELIRTSKTHIVIGTHALIQKDICFNDED